MNTDERRLVRSCWREEGGGRNGSMPAVWVVGLSKAQDMVLADPVGFRLIIVPLGSFQGFPDYLPVDTMHKSESCDLLYIPVL